MGILLSREAEDDALRWQWFLRPLCYLVGIVVYPTNSILSDFQAGLYILRFKFEHSNFGMSPSYILAYDFPTKILDQLERVARISD